MRKLLLIILPLSFFTTQAQQNKNNTLYFEFANTKLTDASQQDITLLIKTLQQNEPAKLIVNGYADKTGTTAFNTKLSYDRADSIMHLLKSILPPGIEITAIGYGSNDPVSEKENEQYLNRRAEIFIEYPVIKDSIIELEAFKEDVQEQHFMINLNDTTTITGKSGTIIKISPQSIQNRSGKLAEGRAELLLKEYYDPSEIIMAGLHTNSDKGLLQTGGMVYMTIIQNGDTMDTKTKKPVQIKMPVVNQDLDDMNVFAFKQHDTAQWKNTGLPFNRMNGFWNWANNLELYDLWSYENRNLGFLKVGRTLTDEYSLGNTFDFSDWTWDRPYAKKIQLNIYKIDSNTARVNARVRYKARGRRQFGRKNLDTTFIVNYMRSQYDGLTDNLNWINCDRFLNYKEKVNVYASTPGYSGLNVMLYFKNIHAFMPAYFSYDKKRENTYMVKNVPANMPVVMVAMGKKGDDFYFGKTEFKAGGKPCSVTITKTSKEEFKNSMKNL